MEEKIKGFSYDGRKDKHTRAMVTDSWGNTKMRMVKEEHVSVCEEPKGRYISHFVPDEPTYPEKPALKVSQALYDLLVKHNSLHYVPCWRFNKHQYRLERRKPCSFRSITWKEAILGNM